MRSTAYIMAGDAGQGFKDLKRALKTDPTLRQGWLNLAGLEIVEKRYDEATKALLEARKLDPAAPDSYLNLGAVAMLQGRTEAATKEFRAYLERAEDLGEAHYLIAANYALGDQAQLAVEHLAAAIERDERFRLRARSDDRFAALTSPQYTALLNSDAYQPPPGAHSVSAAFDTPYSRENPRLLYAVLDAMKELGERYDPKVEATQDWALIWAEMRIKVWNQGNGTGVVSLTAPSERFTADQWHQRSQALFQAVYRILSTPELKPLARRPG
jgi:tetratricopeptide (TPR) repeat protein